jgi:hypothetical protein
MTKSSCVYLCLRQRSLRDALLKPEKRFSGLVSALPSAWCVLLSFSLILCNYGAAQQSTQGSPWHGGRCTQPGALVVVVAHRLVLLWWPTTVVRLSGWTGGRWDGVLVGGSMQLLLGFLLCTMTCPVWSTELLSDQISQLVWSKAAKHSTQKGCGGAPGPMWMVVRVYASVFRCGGWC